MSNFDETMLKRLTKLEREVERLRVKERPVVITDHGSLSGLGDDDHPQYILKAANTLYVGTNHPYKKVSDALAAASNGDTIVVDPGSYPGFTIYPLQFIHIEGSGQPEFNPTTGKLVGGTIFTGKIDLFDSVGSSLNNLGVDVSAGNSDAIDTGSLISGEQHRLNQRFTNLTINCNPSTDTETNTAHCFRSQGGSHLDISNVRAYGGAHGLAIRGSYVNIENCYIEDGLFSAIIVKAIPLTGDAEYVNISNVTCNNTRSASAGSIQAEVWDGSKCRFINIDNCIVVNSAAPSIWIQRKADVSGTGIIEHININNVISKGCRVSAGAVFWLIYANYATLSNCQVISPTTTTLGFYNDGGTNVHGTNLFAYPSSLSTLGFNWQDFSADLDPIGWSSFTKKEAWYAQVGGIVFMTVEIRGPSNSTSVYFDLPIPAATPSYLNAHAYIVDNGDGKASPGFVTLNGETQVVVYRDATGAGFTASGEKRVHVQFFYGI